MSQPIENLHVIKTTLVIHEEITTSIVAVGAFPPSIRTDNELKSRISRMAVEELMRDASLSPEDVRVTNVIVSDYSSLNGSAKMGKLASKMMTYCRPRRTFQECLEMVKAMTSYKYSEEEEFEGLVIHDPDDHSACEFVLRGDKWYCYG